MTGDPKEKRGGGGSPLSRQSPHRYFTGIPHPDAEPADLLAGIDFVNNDRSIGIADVEVVVPIGRRATGGTRPPACRALIADKSASSSGLPAHTP